MEHEINSSFCYRKMGRGLTFAETENLVSSGLLENNPIGQARSIHVVFLRPEALKGVDEHLQSILETDIVATSTSTKSLVPSSDTVIGIVGAFEHAKVAYRFHPATWGRGYATEALKGFLNWFFARHTELQSVVAKVFEHNIASGRVLERCGFKYEGQEQSQNLCKSDPLTVLLYRKFRDLTPEKQESSTLN
ncbi:acyl-CoA N-acyltransferase [Xylona heveae TC161]|uniref:Acyl-CoA N-acyltransferase n=1 Tax=Xylona heveae (strain CBS 132557 / TC161) TaxID=1328760 RepID=A0A164ZGB6_XYLHT|nr:acyl-CoA N-acyltransferase [Xylona heveae TC161]KZF19067.1 acyl-CoA N-acyltransferase [Xylona heveae TC161]